jgi:hypothetical protein
MPTPDKQTVLERLRKLLQQAERFSEQPASCYRTAEFDIWQREVMSWFGKGAPHTDEQWHEFQGLRFTPISYTDTSARTREERWHGSLKIARHLIERAIENLVEDWAPPSGNAEATADRAPSGVTIINQNIQQNSLTIRTVLEEVAREIEVKDPAEGKGFRKTIEKWAENPAIKAVLETLFSAALKHIPGS